MIQFLAKTVVVFACVSRTVVAAAKDLCGGEARSRWTRVRCRNQLRREYTSFLIRKVVSAAAASELISGTGGEEGDSDIGSKRQFRRRREG